MKLSKFYLIYKECLLGDQNFALVNTPFFYIF